MLNHEHANGVRQYNKGSTFCSSHLFFTFLSYLSFYLYIYSVQRVWVCNRNKEHVSLRDSCNDKQSNWCVWNALETKWRVLSAPSCLNHSSTNPSNNFYISQSCRMSTATTLAWIPAEKYFDVFCAVWDGKFLMHHLNRHASHNVMSYTQA